MKEKPVERNFTHYTSDLAAKPIAYGQLQFDVSLLKSAYKILMAHCKSLKGWYSNSLALNMMAENDSFVTNFEEGGIFVCVKGLPLKHEIEEMPEMLVGDKVVYFDYQPVGIGVLNKKAKPLTCYRTANNVRIALEKIETILPTL